MINLKIEDRYIQYRGDGDICFTYDSIYGSRKHGKMNFRGECFAHSGNGEATYGLSEELSKIIRDEIKSLEVSK